MLELECSSKGDGYASEVGITTAVRLLDKHPDKGYSFCLVAMAVKGSRVISYGFNSPKTDPATKYVEEKYNVERMYAHSKSNFVSHCRHAELAAIKKADTDFDTLVVARAGSDGKLLNARPCKICQGLLRENGITTVYYTKNDSFVKEEIRYD